MDCLRDIKEALSPSPVIQIIPVDGCIDIDGDPANAINVTRETTVTDGVPVTVWYTGYGTDAQAEYTGEVDPFVDCDTLEPIPEEPYIPQCVDWEILDAYLPLGDKGVNLEVWNVNNISDFPATSVASDIFVGEPDYSGMPAHDNGVPDGPATCEADLLIVDRYLEQNQWRYWTYLYTTEPIRLREHHGTAEAIDYYLGECCGPPVKAAVGEYLNNDINDLAFDVSLPAGVHYIGGEVFDFSVYSAVNYQYSTDNGVTWTRVPAAWLYKEKPQISKCPVKYCPETQIFADAVTGEALGSEVSLCQPSLCSPTSIVSADGPQCELITLYQVEKLAGSVERKWTTSAVDGPTNAAGHEYLGVFTELDAEGYPAHPNEPDVTEVNEAATTTNVPDAEGIPDDQAIADFWLCIPEGVELFEFNGTAEAVGVWASESCANTMTEILNAPYLNSGQNPLGYYDAGIYRFRLYHHDITANGIAKIVYDNEGTLRPIPGSWVSQTRPTVTPIHAWCCDDGVIWNKDKSEELVLSDSLLMKDPCSGSGCLEC